MNPDLASEKKIRALSAALRKLDSLGVSHWVCNGTLLGIIRDGRLIPWDVDIDIGIPGELQSKQFQESFEDEEMVIFDVGRGSDYLVFDFHGIRVDLNFFHDNEEFLETLWVVPKSGTASRALFRAASFFRIPPSRLGFVAQREGYKSARADVFPIGSVEALGLKIPVPRNPEAVLAFTYGETWQTPIRDYQWRIHGLNNANSQLTGNND